MSSSLALAIRGSAPPEIRVKPRERILVVARDLFYRHGSRAVGVDTIAEAAGTNKMTLYRHFNSKDELIAACLREAAKEFDADFEKIIRLHARDPYAQLVAWMRYIADYLIVEADRGCALANAAIELPEKDHPARRVIEEVKTAQSERLIALCRDAGFVDPEGLADELFLLVEGARVSIQSVGVKGPAARIGRMLKTIIESHERAPHSASN
ncbi:MAG: TetR family transcriptional regulator [Rhodospirillales bacterium]|nr:TetR family transcriptional regulator [Rhodospirillales bacterium]